MTDEADNVEFGRYNSSPPPKMVVRAKVIDGAKHQVIMQAKTDGTLVNPPSEEKQDLQATLAKQNDILTSLSNLLTELQVKADPTERQYVDIRDPYGFHVECTPMDEIRSVTPFRLVGAQFAGDTLDTNFWTSSLGTGGVATVGGAQVILSTGTTANNSASIQSVRAGRYVGGFTRVR